MKNGENGSKKMWAILLHLGSNMWGKPGDCNPCPLEEEMAYHESLYCDKDTWRKVTEYLPQHGINTVVIDMGEAVNLDSHPELAVPGSFEKQEFIKELERLKSMGLTPIPKFNFSCAHNAWMQEYGNMVGTDVYEKVCEDIIRETIEIFDKPEFFHLGLNDENAEYQKYYPVKIVRSAPEKTQAALRLFRVCLEEGVRPWIWADVKTIEEFGGKKKFQENIPKEVLVSNRCRMGVRRVEGEEMPGTALYHELDEWGYEQVPTCHRWSWKYNVKETLRYCKEYVADENIRGYMISSWLLTVPEHYYGLLFDADLLCEAKEMIYPEEA